MTTLVNIRCRSLSLSISREACGAQVTRAYAPAVCRSCEVGAAHARGERPACWPDGEAIKERVHEVERVAVGGGWKPPAAPRYAPQPHKPRVAKPKAVKERAPRVRPPGPPAKTYPLGDRMVTALELSRLPEAVVGVETIRTRLSHGWDPVRAMTTPPQPGLGIEGERFEWHGEQLTVRELASVPGAARGLTPRMLRNRLARWRDVERAVTTPVSASHVERMQGIGERRRRREEEAA